MFAFEAPSNERNEMQTLKQNNYRKTKEAEIRNIDLPSGQKNMIRISN